MPTWRMYIRNEISASDHELEAQKFMETDYYRYWDALLKDERLIRYIEENDLQIIFYPHREMHRFLKYFHVDHPKITVASWPEYDVQTLLKESAVLVTDFSSVAMDFAYMKSHWSTTSLTMKNSGKVIIRSGILISGKMASVRYV